MSLSASQISKEKRNPFLTSKKCLKTLKNEVLEELKVPGLVLRNISGGWGLPKLCGLFCCGTVEEQEDGV